MATDIQTLTKEKIKLEEQKKRGEFEDILKQQADKSNSEINKLGSGLYFFSIASLQVFSFLESPIIVPLKDFFLSAAANEAPIIPNPTIAILLILSIFIIFPLIK